MLCRPSGVLCVFSPTIEERALIKQRSKKFNPYILHEALSTRAINYRTGSRTSILTLDVLSLPVLFSKKRNIMEEQHTSKVNDAVVKKRQLAECNNQKSYEHLFLIKSVSYHRFQKILINTLNLELTVHKTSCLFT